MFHFIKFLFLAAFVFIVLNFFRSNMETAVAIKFQIPLVWEWVSQPVSVNFIVLGVFCLGILFAAAIGAFRMGEVRAEKRRLKESNPPSPPFFKGGDNSTAI
ncbi:MAG: hypothetical protein Q7T11_06175 [Deltaproteobacteria bacterium]|nr:hypothetical protein [Deltaproteobacteria bacterium]